MTKKLILTLFFILYTCNQTFAKEYTYLFNDKCIEYNYTNAKNIITDSDINIIRNAIGLIIRFEIKNPYQEFYNLSYDTMNKLKKFEKFLAKYKNPVIIEVHTEKFKNESEKGIRNWELSTVIANNIEEYLTKIAKTISSNKISSVGYGEFLPAKNTSNNGGKYSNRVDIIIPCSISGE